MIKSYKGGVHVINKQKILIVDDSLMICQRVKSVLSVLPATIYDVHTGKDALDMIVKIHPDLIILDIILPDIEGFDLIYKIKEIDESHANIVFLTARDQNLDVIKGLSSGAYDYIKKPFVDEEFLTRIQNQLLIKKQRDELCAQNEILKSNMEKLNYIAYRDSLTGLYNRRFVTENLPKELAEKENEATNHYFVLTDIDNFKIINDTFGHDAGDKVLICFAEILNSFKVKHRAIRWGGEEFLIILFNLTLQQAKQIVEEIREEIESFEFVHKQNTFHCTMTFGLYPYNPALEIDENVHCADLALYQGKSHGKNCCVWYHDEK
ncbi:diguanylate cyclase domain protein [Candidatus Stoquefichus sp. KLE1796]|nr:diguanylate cyclase domain protein [Candidatus Stoquefichus sp. KLE1796]